MLNKLREYKGKIQRVIRGYSDDDVFGLKHFIVEKLRDPLKKFVAYEEENGMSLPQEFTSDPAAWLLILQKMAIAFDSTWYDDNQDENPYTRGMTNDEVVEHNKQVKEGFELFGKYAMDLWD